MMLMTWMRLSLNLSYFTKGRVKNLRVNLLQSRVFNLTVALNYLIKAIDMDVGEQWKLPLTKS